MCTGAELLIISSAVTAASSISQGAVVKQQSDFQEKIDRQQADRLKQISAIQEEDFRRRQSRVLAERRAALGSAGVKQDTGTSLLAAKDFAAETELQALRVRAGGENQATRLEQQAQLTRAGGRSAQNRGFLRAGSSLLSGFSRFKTG